MNNHSQPIKICNIRTDGGTQPRAEIDIAVVAEYADDMARGDVFPPVRVVYDGSDYWLVDGFHRVQAAKKCSRQTIESHITQGTVEDARWLSLAANARHGKRRTRADKQRAIKRALMGWAVEKSDNQIAKHVGCHHVTVGKYRKELELTCEIHKSEKRIGADGRKINTSNIGTNQGGGGAGGVDGQQSAPAPMPMEDAWGGEPRESGGGVKQKIHPVAANSVDDPDGDEWYTPRKFIESARLVLGSIDVDPASNPKAQEVVGAKKWFGKDDDGLARQWHGNVFVNPPYSYPLVENFVDKLLEEFESGRTKQAIILVNNCTDTKWFHKLLGSYPVCFTLGRVKFWRENQQSFATRQGQAFFYLGGNPDKFVEVFSQHGAVLGSISGGRSE